MKIKTIIIDNKQFDFSHTTLIHSKHNSVGKTTLIRLLLYGMGYTIPSTNGFDFNSKRIKLVLLDSQNEEMTFLRNGYELRIYSKKIKKEYYLKKNGEDLGHLKILSILYQGITEPKILSNMLGLHYFDQDKGWTLFNGGKVIGGIHFNIDSLLEGLTSLDIAERNEKIKNLKDKKKTYNQLQTVLKWKSSFDFRNDNINWENFDKLQNQLKSIDFEIDKKQTNLKKLRDIKLKNTDFEEYISDFRIRVKTSAGDNIIVTKDNIVGFEENQKIIDTKIAIEKRELEKLQLKRIEKNDHINDEIGLVDNQERISHFVEAVSNLDLNINDVKKIINNINNNLNKEKKNLESSLKSNNIINEIYNRICSYADILGVRKCIDRDSSFLFKHRLTGYSGALRHLTYYGFKLAILKEIQEKFGLSVPIILDSPRSGELTSENFEKMLKLLFKDFSENQLIIASIYKPEEEFDKQIILTKSLLNSGKEVDFE